MMQKNYKIVSIEGNIGSGKTHLLTCMKKYYTGNENVVFIDEPVEEWEQIKGADGNSILKKFYADPAKYGFSLQMLAYISRLSNMKKIIEEYKDKKNVIFVTERCLLTDKLVFAQMLFDKGDIEDVNYQIYSKWFDAFAHDYQVDKIIYVRTSPEICKERIERRSREGESEIGLDYLGMCHEYHDRMMTSLTVPQLNLKGDIDVISFAYKMVEWLWTINQFM